MRSAISASDASLDESLAIDIGRRLGATWVVVGGFQRIGELVRITANFVVVATGTIERTVKVDGRIGDIFALQDKIVFELSQGLNVALRGTEIAGIERRETRSVEAYESYARGMMNLRLASRDSIERAIAAFEQATRYDPGVRQRVGGARRRVRAEGFVPQPQRARRPRRRDRTARHRTRRSLRRPHCGGALLHRQGRTDDAIAEISEAIRLDGENGQAHQALARALWVGKGDFAGAIPLSRNRSS